jgi:hypothetical protein
VSTGPSVIFDLFPRVLALSSCSQDFLVTLVTLQMHNAHAYFENPKPKSARGGCKAGACGCWLVCVRYGARAEPKFSSSAREASQDGSCCWYSKSEAGSVTV